MYELSSRPCCVLSMTCLNNFRCVVIHQSNWIGLVGKIEAGNHGFSHEILGVPLNFPTKTNRMSASGCLCPKSTLKLCEASWDFVGPSSNRQLTWISRGIGTEKLLLYIYIAQLRLKNPLIPTRLNPLFLHPYFCKLNHVLRPQAAKTHDALRWAVGIEGIPRKEKKSWSSCLEWWVCGVFWYFTRKMMEHDHWTHGILMDLGYHLQTKSYYLPSGNQIWQLEIHCEWRCSLRKCPLPRKTSKNCGRNVCFSATNQYRPKVVQQIWTRKTNWKNSCSHWWVYLKGCKNKNIQTTTH